MTVALPALRRIDAVLLLVLLAVAAILGWQLIPALVDDSFIYLRVAANIGAGNGWLYNIGEPANPATSVTYTLLLTMVGWLVGYGAHALATTSAVTLGALAVVQYLAWRESDGRIAGMLVALSCLASARLLGAFGMESALLLSFVSATALAYRHRGDHVAVGVLAGLAALTRPEGIIVAGVVGLLMLVQRRIAWRIAVGALLTMLPWIVFATLAFGTPLSQTAAVKAAQRHVGWWGTQPDFIVGFMRQPIWPWLTVALAACGLLLAIRRARRNDAFALVCIGFGILQVLGYQLLGAPRGYSWYLAPGNFAVDLAILLAGIALAHRLAERVSSPMRGNFVLAGAAIALLLAITRIGMAPAYLPGRFGFSQDYRLAADWLRDHSLAEDTVAATEIGYLGWYSGLRIRDIHGLLHPQALPALREGKLWWWYDRTNRPRFVVVHIPPWHGEPGSTSKWPDDLQADFDRHYRRVFDYNVVEIYEFAVQR